MSRIDVPRVLGRRIDERRVLVRWINLLTIHDWLFVIGRVLLIVHILLVLGLSINRLLLMLIRLRIDDNDLTIMRVIGMIPVLSSSK